MVSGDPLPPFPTADWIPATIVEAPKRTKQPTMTVAPWRTRTRPVSIMNPIDATARIATVSAIVPNSVFCNQRVAATTGLEPIGSASDDENEAAALKSKVFTQRYYPR